jgi:hypothetical protein
MMVKVISKVCLFSLTTIFGKTLKSLIDEIKEVD